MAYYIIVRNSNGNLNVPYLIENDGKVILNWNWLDNDWNSNNPALRFATYFISKCQHFMLAFSFSFLLVVLLIAHSIHLAFYLFRLFSQKEKYIFWYRVILFQIKLV